MATTETISFGDGTTTQFSFTFPYIKTEDVRVELQEFDTVESTVISRVQISSFSIPANNPTVIQFAAIGAATNYQAITGAPLTNHAVNTSNIIRVRIYRFTSAVANPSTFIQGSAVRAQDLNDNFEQILYIMQERQNTLQTIQLGGIGENIIGTVSIQDDAITADKLRDSTVTDSDRAVTTNHIRNDAVTTAKIVDNAITTAKIVDGAVTTAKIVDDAVTTDKIVNDAVTTDKIVDNAITTAKITNLNVTTAKIADANVTTDKIADVNVTTAKIADDAVTADKLANTAVTAGTYSAADITVDAQGRITAAASGAISTAEIENDAVTADKLADTAVTAGSYTYSNLTVDAQGRLTAASSAVSPIFQSYAIICDEKTAGTSGGTYNTISGFATRDLNTEISDADNIVSLSSNRFSLAAGNYLIEWSSPARHIGRFQTRLYNYTDSSVVQYGMSGDARDDDAVVTSEGAARVVITDTKEFEIQLRGANSRFGFGLGLEVNFGTVEIYTTVKIYKEI